MAINSTALLRATSQPHHNQVNRRFVKNCGKSPGEASKQKNTHFFILDLALCTGKSISDPLRDDEEGSKEQCSEGNSVHGKTTQKDF